MRWVTAVVALFLNSRLLGTVGAPRGAAYIVAFPDRAPLLDIASARSAGAAAAGAAGGTADGDDRRARAAAARRASVREAARDATAAMLPGSINVTAYFSLLFDGLRCELSERAVAYFEARGATVALDRIVRKAQPGLAPLRWGLDRIDQRALPLDGIYAPAGDGGAGAHIFVIDSGINSAHVEFEGRVGDGFDFVDDDALPEDCDGHGTHCAGVAAGATLGVAPLATLHALRVLDCRGSGLSSNVVRALEYAAAHPARIKIASISLGGSFSAIENRAVDSAVLLGLTVVVAAGNSATDACRFSPGSAASAINVGATSASDGAATFTNYGDCVALFAPGTEIVSAYVGGPTALRLLSGTSMACPHVAGAAALLANAQARAGTYSPAQVRAELIARAAGGVVVATRRQNNQPNRLLQVPQRAAAVPPQPRAPASAVTSSPSMTPASPPAPLARARPSPSPPPTRAAPRPPPSPPPPTTGSSRGDDSGAAPADGQTRRADERDWVEIDCALTLSGAPREYAAGSAGARALVGAVAAAVGVPSAAVGVLSVVAASARIALRIWQVRGVYTDARSVQQKLADPALVAALSAEISRATGASVEAALEVTRVSTFEDGTLRSEVEYPPTSAAAGALTPASIAALATVLGGGAACALACLAGGCLVRRARRWRRERAHEEALAGTAASAAGARRRGGAPVDAGGGATRTVT